MSGIEDQSAAWLAREDRGLSPAESAERDAWLQADTQHRIVYLRQKSVWLRANRLQALRSPALPPSSQHTAKFTPMPGFFAPTGSTHYWTGLCATLFFAVFCLSAPLAGGLYETSGDQQESFHLADGSLLELNGHTRLRLRITQNGRHVILEKGEAYFAMSPDEQRPLIVQAGQNRIFDQGTKFAVKHQGETVQIIVSEGELEIETLHRSGDRPAQSTAPLTKSVRLQQEMQAISNAAGMLISKCSTQDIARSLRWRKSLLIFKGGSLETLVARINNFNDKKLVLEDDSVRQTQLGGSFDATNLQGFARLLQDGFGFTLKDTGSEIRISNP